MRWSDKPRKVTEYSLSRGIADPGFHPVTVCYLPRIPTRSVPFQFMKSLICSLLFALLSAPFASAADFELRDGDRVVFLGDGLIEQEQYFGWVEVMMSNLPSSEHGD